MAIGVCIYNPTETLVVTACGAATAWLPGVYCGIVLCAAAAAAEAHATGKVTGCVLHVDPVSLSLVPPANRQVSKCCLSLLQGDLVEEEDDGEAPAANGGFADE